MLYIFTEKAILCHYTNHAYHTYMQIPSTLCSVAPVAPPTSVPHPLPHLHHVALEYHLVLPRVMEQYLPNPRSPRGCLRYRGKSCAITCQISRVKVRCHMIVQVRARGQGRGGGKGRGGGAEGRRERAPVVLQEEISAPMATALPWPSEGQPGEGEGADHHHRFPAASLTIARHRLCTMAPWHWQFTGEGIVGIVDIKCKSHEV